MDVIVHFSRKLLKDCSRMQSQVELEHGKIYQLKSYISFMRPIQYIKSLSSDRDVAITCVFHQQRSLFILVMCHLFTRSPNVKFLYDMHDLNELRNSSGVISRLKDKMFFALSYFFEFYVARSTIKVITVSRGLSRIFYMRYRKSCHLFYNMPSRELMSPNLKRSVSSGRETINVCYFGVLKDARIPQTLIEDLVARGVQFDIYGTVDPEYKQKLEAIQLFKQPNVHFKGAYRGGQIVTTLAASDYNFTLCVFDVNTMNLRFSMPNKVFQSLCAGIPVLCAPELKEVLLLFKKLGAVKAYPQKLEELHRVVIDQQILSQYLQKIYEANRLRYIHSLSLNIGNGQNARK